MNMKPGSEQIVESLRAMYFRTRRGDPLLSAYARLLQKDGSGSFTGRPLLHTATGETRSIALIDRAGGGKTTLVSRILDRHPARTGPAAGRMPVISVSVPNPATLKSLGLEILRASGYPDVSMRRERWDIWNMVRTRFQLLGTMTLWVDEAHDLFTSANAREINDILKTLKGLMQGPGAVIILLSGTEELARITALDEQISRRFSRIVMPDVTETADGDMLWHALRDYCGRAGLMPPEPGQDLIRRLIHASRGRFGRSLEAMISAIGIALELGHDHLDIQHFAEAFFAHEGAEPCRNPYLAARWERIDVSAPAC